MTLKAYLQQVRGRSTHLSAVLKVTVSLVSMWAGGSRVIPVGRCLEIERATGGRVLAHRLRPDVDWTREKK